MPKSNETPTPASLLSALKDIQSLKQERISSSGLDPKLALLRNWQSERLARTYADLLADRRYRPACLFFLQDIYAARDFSQRDHDILQMYDFMRRVFPENMIRPLQLTVEVHTQTNALDARLLEVLVGELGLTDTLTEALYAEAYRRCDNYVERVRQIDLIYKIGSELEGLVRSPLTGAALTVARVPARRAGYIELTEFIERGYNAFRQMRNAEHFLNTIRQRERLILDRIYAEEADPFTF